jgi:hypothetical protein
VLIVVWQLAIDAVPEAPPGMLRLLAARPRVAIEHAGLRARMERSRSPTRSPASRPRRVFEEELPREIARARRGELPLTVAMLDLDHLGAFNMLRGEREGDRLIKEAAALWRGELREVDTLRPHERRDFADHPPELRVSATRSTCSTASAPHATRPDGLRRVARWDGEEPVELLQARCEEALARPSRPGATSRSPPTDRLAPDRRPAGLGCGHAGRGRTCRSRRNTALLSAALAANSAMLQLSAAVASLTLVLVIGVEGLLGLGPAIVLAAGALAALPAGG